MKSYLLSATLLAAAAFPQTAPPVLPDDVPDSAVLATYGDGKQFTYADAKMFLKALPPEQQRATLANRRSFVQKTVLMLHMAELAEKAKLYEQSPAKEEIYLNRVYTLSGAQFNEAFQQFQVSDGDMEKFYQANQDRYTQVKVKGIYIRFSTNPQPPVAGTKYLTEAEAKAKADKIVAQIKAGADFVKLVKEHSEDETSMKKDGDFDVIRRSDNIPEAVRTVLFALKRGEVSAPIHQQNGFYIFRAEEVGLRPLLELKGDIQVEIRQEMLKKYVTREEESLKVKYTGNKFFSNPASPAGELPPPGPRPGPPPAK